MAVRHSPGWTLFELLVVVAILGVVAPTFVLHPAPLQHAGKLDVAASEPASALRFLDPYDGDGTPWPVS